VLIDSNLPIRQTVSGEFENTIRHPLGAELQRFDSEDKKWMPSAKILPLKLSYAHLKQIATIDNPVKRAFYVLEATKGIWSRRELERQIDTLYYERSGLSKNKKALSALVNQQTVQLLPKDFINTPITLEFLGLNERALVTENDLEQAILDNLQAFLLEMGRGFCFEARQKRILIDDEYFFVDLLFYHRILKCHVVVELKVDKFRHEYASQLNMYLNYFKHEEMAADDNPPVGILLCTEKGNTQVKYATAGLDENIFIQKYLMELPDENMLKEYITKEFYNFSHESENK
jgi:predicted nuclease of restriction endonuclease-like (RecB) superfamily